MKVKIKKLHQDAVIPKYAKSGDAGLDLIAVSRSPEDKFFPYVDYIEYGTGVALEIPEGYVGLIFPRSSISSKDYSFTNSVGVIDSGYRGEISLRLKCNKIGRQFNERIKEYEIGDKIGQLIILPYPQIELEEVNELSSSERGVGGFGSSGQ